MSVSAEQYANLNVSLGQSQTTLSGNGGSITSGATSLKVAAATGFPAAAQYRILIENEILIVTAGAGTTTWTVTRGAEGTTAASHNDGVTVTHILTAGGLTGVCGQTILSDVSANIPAAGVVGRIYAPTNGTHLLRDTGSAWSPWGPAFPMTTPFAQTGPQTTTLSGNGGSITSGATSLNVASSSGFPATPFLVQIGSEDLKVTNVSSLTWTVVRGYNGTTAASHNDGDTVTQVNWEWVNQGGATLFNMTDYQCLYAPSAGNAHNCRILKTVAPATPYTVTAYIDGLIPANTATRYGLLFRESSSGKFSAYQFEGAAPPGLEVTFYSGPTAPVSVSGALSVPMLYSWIRIKDDGTNRLYSFSRDGQNWVQQFSESRTLNFTADEYGWFVNPIITTGTNVDSLACLYSLKLS